MTMIMTITCTKKNKFTIISVLYYPFGKLACNYRGCSKFHQTMSLYN